MNAVLVAQEPRTVRRTTPSQDGPDVEKEAIGLEKHP